MHRNMLCAVALAMAMTSAQAQDSVREEIKQLQQRLQQLEKRLEQTESTATQAAVQPAADGERAESRRVRDSERRLRQFFARPENLQTEWLRTDDG